MNGYFCYVQFQCRVEPHETFIRLETVSKVA